jgi:hypothetical protein
MIYGHVDPEDSPMTPEEYIEQLKQFAIDREPDRLLEFAVEHGPGLQDSMTDEQWQQESTLAERAIMLADLEGAARQQG